LPPPTKHPPQPALAGYGAAQAVPGPLFTFAAYLGTVAALDPHGVPGAVPGFVGIFLPGLLMLLGAMRFSEPSGAGTTAPGRRRAALSCLPKNITNAALDRSACKHATRDR